MLNLAHDFNHETQFASASGSRTLSRVSKNESRLGGFMKFDMLSSSVLGSQDI